LRKINAQKKKKGVKSIVAIILLGIICFCLFKMFEQPTRVVSGLPENDANLSTITNEDLLKMMQDEVDKDNLNILLINDIDVNNSTKSALVDVRNSYKSAYGIQVEYFLTEGNKLLYRSGLIPPNNRLKEVVFDHVPEAGVHDIYINYHTYDEQKMLATTVIDGQLTVN
jgi:hypothetical protein